LFDSGEELIKSPVRIIANLGIVSYPFDQCGVRPVAGKKSSRKCADWACLCQLIVYNCNVFGRRLHSWGELPLRAGGNPALFFDNLSEVFSFRCSVFSERPRLISRLMLAARLGDSVVKSLVDKELGWRRESETGGFEGESGTYVKCEFDKSFYYNDLGY